MTVTNTPRTFYAFGLILSLLTTLLLTGCDEQPPASKKHSKSLPNVEVIQAKREPLNHKIIVTGTLEPVRTVRFYNQVQGLLVELPFREGDRLKKGQLLTRAKTKVLLDTAEFNLQKKRLSYTRINAPWDGIISERKAEPGDVLPLHTHFLSLIDTSALIVKVAISELYLSRIHQGDSIHFIIDALGTTVWNGKVLRIYPQGNH